MSTYILGDIGNMKPKLTMPREQMRLRQIYRRVVSFELLRTCISDRI